jgi:nicotinic acid mononucleotide adenylyltransferase
MREASSVAKDVATNLGIQHLFCDPDTGERRATGLQVGEELRTQAMTVSKKTGREWTDVHHAEIKKQFSTREAVWLERLEGCKPNNRSIIFVCGADHVDTFKAALDAKKFLAGVRCRGWTKGA